MKSTLILVTIGGATLLYLLIRKTPKDASAPESRIDFIRQASEAIHANDTAGIDDPVEPKTSRRKARSVDEIDEDSSEYNYEIVGESFQRDHLVSLIRVHKAFDTGEILTTATLELEPTNEFDPTAVKVMIEGLQVGHIPKYDSPAVTKMITKSGKNGMEVAARIGFDPSSPQPFIGVKISLTVE